MVEKIKTTRNLPPPPQLLPPPSCVGYAQAAQTLAARASAPAIAAGQLTARTRDPGKHYFRRTRYSVYIEKNPGTTTVEPDTVDI